MPIRTNLRHELDHSVLDDRRLAGSDEIELRLIDVDARHTVAVARETRERHRSDVAESEYADMHS